MSVGGADAVFKCRVLHALGTIDPRFPALVRLVKAWASAQGINNASRGTFSTYGLVLLVRNLFIATFDVTRNKRLSIN